MIQTSLDALVAFFTLGVITSPLWGGIWLTLAGRRRRVAAARALARAWSAAEKVALWEARKTGPEAASVPAQGVVVHVFVVRVARLHDEERHVGSAVEVATVRTLGDKGHSPRFLADVDEAMEKAHAIAADLNATRLV